MNDNFYEKNVSVTPISCGHTSMIKDVTFPISRLHTRNGNGHTRRCQSWKIIVPLFFCTFLLLVLIFAFLHPLSSRFVFGN